MYVPITGEAMTESGWKLPLKRIGKLSDLTFNIQTLEKLEYAISSHIRKVCIDFMKGQLFVTDKHRTRVM